MKQLLMQLQRWNEIFAMFQHLVPSYLYKFWCVKNVCISSIIPKKLPIGLKLLAVNIAKLKESLDQIKTHNEFYKLDNPNGPYLEFYFIDWMKFCVLLLILYTASDKGSPMKVRHQ